MEIKLEWYRHIYYDWILMHNVKIIKEFKMFFKKFRLEHWVSWYWSENWKKDYFCINSDDNLFSWNFWM